MTRDQLRSQYADVVPGLEYALNSEEGIHFPCTSYSAAIRLQQRVRKFIKAYREAAPATSPFDRLYSPNIPKGSTDLYVKPRPAATFILPTGETVENARPVDIVEPLDSEALALADEMRKKLLGD